MKPIILFRADNETQDEFFVAQKYFEVTKNRNAIPADRLVIGRYSTLPHFRELEEYIKLAGSKMIDSYREFNYIASFDYYHDIEKYTFKTYFEPRLIPDDSGPLVVKGTTNSRKRILPRKCLPKIKKQPFLLLSLYVKILFSPIKKSFSANMRN